MTQQQTCKNLEDIRHLNRVTIISILQKCGVVSRAEISKMSGLKQSTITNIINEFIDLNIALEVGSMRGNRGRRSIGVDLNDSQLRFISLRIAREYVEVGLFDIKCKPYCFFKAPFTNETLYRVIADLIAEIKPYTKNKIVLSAGIAVGNSLIHKSKIVPIAPSFSVVDLDEVKKIFINTFNVPVFVENDANLAGYYEWNNYFGFNESGTLLFIHVGTGLGAGIVIDGEIFNGSSGIAGEIGHMSIDCNGPLCECGNHGCLQALVSGIALKRMLEEYTPEFKTVLTKKSTIADLIDAYQDGDALAYRIIDEMSSALGTGIGNMNYILNPSVIVLFGDIFKIDDMYKKTCEKASSGIITSFSNYHIEISKSTKPILLGACMLAINGSMFSEDFFSDIQRKVNVKRP